MSPPYPPSLQAASVLTFAQGIALLEQESQPLAAHWQGFRLQSHFQPIVSFSHRCIVGHEGLVRATDPSGKLISPLSLLRLAPSIEALISLDRLCRMLHVMHASRLGLPGFLFLNMHPLALANLDQTEAAEFNRQLIEYSGFAADRLIIEVTEDALTDDSAFESSVSHLRKTGFRIALDDFGAGHSNFDRVWRLQPEVVKLDRSFAVRASSDPSARRLLPQIIELLHEAGSIVLLEGIETKDQARIAMAADVDFAQGYHFGHPCLTGATEGETLAAIDAVWLDYDATRADDSRHYQERVAPYANSLTDAATLLAEGCSLRLAIAGFLELDQAMRCYVLDEMGFQIGRNLSPREINTESQGFTPNFDARRSRWSRRPYFARALENAGKVSVTRPYLCISSSTLCITVSISYRIQGETRVLCGDVAWA